MCPLFFVPFFLGGITQVVKFVKSGSTVPQARFITNVTVKDITNGNIFKGTVDLKPTLDRITAGVKYPHANDGTVFNNFPLKGKITPELPVKPSGYYTEYVHPTPGISRVGPQRIVTGKNGEMYYTPDHYESFIQVR